MSHLPQDDLSTPGLGNPKLSEERSALSCANEIISPLSSSSPPPRRHRQESADAMLEDSEDVILANLLAKVNAITNGEDETTFSPTQEGTVLAENDPERNLSASKDTNTFVPTEPKTFQEAGLTDSEVEALILKYLLARGDIPGRDIAAQLKLPFLPIAELLQQMKFDQLVGHKGAAKMNDYVYLLSDIGRERAKRYAERCTYFGAAPVTLADYIAGVQAQSLEGQAPTEADLQRAFDDLLINPNMLSRLGPAVNSGRGLFLFGAPGNGKTSIAERVSQAFGRYIWIPRAIGIDGEIIRLFDPSNHEEAPLAEEKGLLDDAKIDKRWVRICRPTIAVGGELTMDSLEVTFNPTTGISEAPIQMKSNCGILLIDDFGRQRMTTDELLNRWIVPLEKRFDFLNLANGKKIQVPFDQLIIFSTNLEPRDLCDDAFLRRIPYKIEITDPAEEEFRQLFKMMCPGLGFEYNEQAIDYLLEEHYHKTKRAYRCCQPRDLLLQVRNHCLYHKVPLELTPEYFDYAVENYFAVM